MVVISNANIETKEVLNWKGFHLFHYWRSSCSRKVRIYLRLKGIEFVSHHINLPKGENTTDFYLGINPRGLVPVLVHNGVVHAESNDILLYLEGIQLDDDSIEHHSLLPENQADKERAKELLSLEDDLHLPLRCMTFYRAPYLYMLLHAIQDKNRYTKKKQAILSDQSDLTGEDRQSTLQSLEKSIEFYTNYLDQRGISKEQLLDAYDKFNNLFDQLNQQLIKNNNNNDQKEISNPHLFGSSPTLVDIAFWVYISRVELCGFPLEKNYPQLHRAYKMLSDNPAFQEELKIPDRLAGPVSTLINTYNWVANSSFENVVDPTTRTPLHTRIGSITGITLLTALSALTISSFIRASK